LSALEMRSRSSRTDVLMRGRKLLYSRASGNGFIEAAGRGACSGEAAQRWEARRGHKACRAAGLPSSRLSSERGAADAEGWADAGQRGARAARLVQVDAHAAQRLGGQRGWRLRLLDLEDEGREPQAQVEKQVHLPTHPARQPPPPHAAGARSAHEGDEGAWGKGRGDDEVGSYEPETEGVRAT
jgi:hypothetical protein